MKITRDLRATTIDSLFVSHSWPAERSATSGTRCCPLWTGSPPWTSPPRPWARWATSCWPRPRRSSSSKQLQVPKDTSRAPNPHRGCCRIVRNIWSFVFSRTLFLNLSENDMGLRKALKEIQQDIEIEYPAFIQGDMLRMRQLERHFESAYIRQHQKPYMALIRKWKIMCV